MIDYLKSNIENLEDVGGSAILKIYNNSPSLLLSTVFPEFPWRFDVVPKNHWDSLENCKKFVDSLAVHNNIKDMSDWYKITAEVEISWNVFW
jgi:hypothetical protein